MKYLINNNAKIVISYLGMSHSGHASLYSTNNNKHCAVLNYIYMYTSTWYIHKFLCTVIISNK